MALQYRATQSETAERYYTCNNCGARAEVVFHAFGDSGWHKDSLLSDDAEERARAAAEEDLMTDAERVLHLIKCPTCKQRHPSYVRWAMFRVVAWFAIAGLVFWWGGTDLWIGVAIPAVGGGFQGWREHHRFVRADRAFLKRLKPGKVEKPEPKQLPAPKPVLAPPPDLPVARAISVPVMVPVAIEPRGPDEEPAFLRDKK